MTSNPLAGKCLAITGGTGSLGKVLVRRLLRGELGELGKLVVFSRDEAKQHAMRVAHENKKAVTDELIYDNFKRRLEFRIGDVRDFASVVALMRDADYVVNAAALKQVPTAEYHPYEAVRTNVVGAENIVRAIEQFRFSVNTVVGVSTDKACQPVNVMGMTKALQERVFVQANLRHPQTRFVCVRYGNVLASRGSIIPLFHEQIRLGGPVTLTTSEMTRFLLSLDDAVNTVFAAIRGARRGETYIPRIPAVRIADLARSLIDDRPVESVFVGIRPGEKIHEILVGEDEAPRTVKRGEYYAIRPMLPELSEDSDEEEGCLAKPYSSKDSLLTLEEVGELLKSHRLLVDDAQPDEGEMLR